MVDFPPFFLSELGVNAPRGQTCHKIVISSSWDKILKIFIITGDRGHKHSSNVDLVQYFFKPGKRKPRAGEFPFLLINLATVAHPCFSKLGSTYSHREKVDKSQN